MEPLNGVVLTCSDWQATVLPQFGCNLVQLSYAGQQLLRTPASLAELAQSPYLYGCPVLMPGNRVRNGRFCLHGRTHTLPLNEPQLGNHLHGLLFNAPFAVTEHSPTTLSATLTDDGERFPFPFALTQRFVLTEQGLAQELLLRNRGELALPVSLALHTTFCAPAEFCVPIGERYDRDDRYLPTGALLPLDSREQAFVTGAVSEGQVISGYYTATGDRARIGNWFYRAEGFDHWVLFNGGGTQGFLCVEPQLGAVNSLGDGTAPLLPDGQSLLLRLTFGRA